MLCTFANIAACFSLSGIYFNASLIHSDVGIVRYYDTVQSATLLSPLPANGLPALPPTSFDIRYTTAMQRIDIGQLESISAAYDVQFSKRWSASIQYSREWSNKYRDYESNRYQASITWRPFAR